MKIQWKSCEFGIVRIPHNAKYPKYDGLSLDGPITCSNLPDSVATSVSADLYEYVEFKNRTSGSK